MNEVLVRTITGAIFISLIIFGVVWDEFSTMAVFGLFCVLGLHEFYKLFKKSKFPELKIWYPTIVGSVFYFAFFGPEFGYFRNFWLLLIIPFVFGFFLIELFRKSESPLEHVGIYLMGFIYVLLPFLLMNFINPKNFEGEIISFWPLLGMFIIIWTSDTFAYLTGRKFGKRRLFERISPKKSWEGSIGGLVFALIAASIISYFDDAHNLVFWLTTAPILVVFGTIGDLVESMLKRNLEVKDSGTILPGHGGILDRFDAVLFAAPFVFVFHLILDKI